MPEAEVVPIERRLYDRVEYGCHLRSRRTVIATQCDWEIVHLARATTAVPASASGLVWREKESAAKVDGIGDQCIELA